MRFCDLAVGAAFEFRGRRYVKMNGDIGRDEERGGNVFHANTEVVAAVPRGPERAGRVEVVEEPEPEVVVRLIFTAADDAEGATGWAAPRPRYRSGGGRLGRRPDRELRPYGTL